MNRTGESFRKEMGKVDRKSWDRIVSGAGAVVAVVLLALGAVAIFGGMFGRDNVRDRLVPQKIAFPQAEAMSAAEKAEVEEFAGATVDTGTEAEAFSRYIGVHLADVNDGKTYSETSAMARAEGLSEKEAATLNGMADLLFKGESLRGLLLNAYGWWTVATLAMFAGYAMVAFGLLMAAFAALGFRHSRKVAPAKTAAASQPITA